MILEVDAIVSAGNVRFDENDIADLAASIDRSGLLQPLVVVQTLDGDATDWTLIAGHRRLAAVKSLGWKEVQVVVNDTLENAADRMSAQYAENVHRKGLSAFEQMQVALDLKAEGMNQAAVAAELGLSKEAVSKAQKIARLIPEEQYATACLFSETGLDDLVKQAEGNAEVIAEALPIVAKGNTVWQSVQQAQSAVRMTQFNDVAAGWLKMLGDLGVPPGDTVPAYDVDWMPVAVFEPVDGELAIKDMDEYRRRQFLDVPVKEHREMTCHAATVVDGWDGTYAVEYCFRPNDHADVSKVVKGRVQHDESEKEKAKADRKAKLQRKEDAAEWVKGIKVSDPDLVPIIDAAIEEWSTGYMAQALAKALGMEKVMHGGSYSQRDTVRQWVQSQQATQVGQLKLLAALMHATRYVDGYSSVKKLGKV